MERGDEREEEEQADGQEGSVGGRARARCAQETGRQEKRKKSEEEWGIKEYEKDNGMWQSEGEGKLKIKD